MNEALQNTLNEFLQKAMAGIDASADFLAAELPDVISELLLWYGVYNFLLMLGGITIAIVFYFGMKKLWTVTRDHPDGDFVFGLTAACSVFAVGIPVAVMINIEWLQIWIAPKLWLLEYSANLVK